MTEPRCPACAAPAAACFCDRIPFVPATTRVIVVRHPRERFKVSNTGAFAARVIGGTVVDYTTSALDDVALGPTPHLLYPHGNDRPWPVPSTLVVLDGTWREASRMRRRLAPLAGMPVLTLPPDRHEATRMRERPVETHMSTIEAIAGALDRLGEPAPAAALREVTRVMTEVWLTLRQRR